MKDRNKENRLLIANSSEAEISDNSEIYLLGFYNNKSNFCYNPLINPFHTQDTGTYFNSLLFHHYPPKSEDKEFDFFLEQLNLFKGDKMDCPNNKTNKAKCNCTYSCDKKGNCCACLAYHRQNNELPACYFDAKSEKTYNRSLEFFISLKK